MENTEILQPVLVGWLMSFVAQSIKGRAPQRAYSRAIKRGATSDQASEIYQKEDLNRYRASRSLGVFGGWYVLAFILAFEGNYPDSAITACWALAIAMFVLALIQSSIAHDTKEKTKTLMGLLLIPTVVVMIVSLVWLIIIALKVVFS